MSTIIVGIYQLDPDDAFVAEFPLLWTEALSRDLRVASIGDPQIISPEQYQLLLKVVTELAQYEFGKFEFYIERWYD
jgi:hypothetical protein